MLKSKHLWHTVLSILMCGCFLLLPSCSSDEPDSDENQTDATEDTLSDAARNFVGYWSLTWPGSELDYMIMYADGCCCGVHDNSAHIGYWAFDEATSVLTTTIDNGKQWQITLLNSGTWVGLYVDNGKTCTATKYGISSEFRNYVEWGTWISNSTKMELNNNGCVDFENPPFEMLPNKQYYMTFSDEVETDNGCTGSYNIWYYNGGVNKQIVVNGSFTYVNANYYKSCKWVFSGGMNLTFSRDLSDIRK
jgi:hypothetical protein